MLVGHFWGDSFFPVVTVSRYLPSTLVPESCLSSTKLSALGRASRIADVLSSQIRLARFSCNFTAPITNAQVVVQGVPFTGVQVLR